MKVGFSLGRCVRDIVKGLVDVDDVVVIVTGTDIHSQDQLVGVIKDYMYRSDYLKGLDEESCQGVASVLWREGKLHQPRSQGAPALRINEYAVWADLVPTGGHEDPMVKDAWQEYRTLLGLTSTVPDKDLVNNEWKS